MKLNASCKKKKKKKSHMKISESHIISCEIKWIVWKNHVKINELCRIPIKM